MRLDVEKLRLETSSAPTFIIRPISNLKDVAHRIMCSKKCDCIIWLLVFIQSAEQEERKSVNKCGITIFALAS